MAWFLLCSCYFSIISALTLSPSTIDQRNQIWQLHYLKHTQGKRLEFGMEIVGFVMQIGECLWAPAKRHIGYLVRYKSNLEFASQQTEKLRIRKQDILVAANAAKNNGYEIKSEVEKWLKSAEDEINRIEIWLKEEGEEDKKKKCLICWCPDLCGRYKLSKQAVKDATALGELLAGGEFEHVSLQAKRPLGIEFTMPVDADFELFESTRKAMDEVVKALENGDVRIVGLYGMGGVGKTALMKKLGAHLQQKGLFNQVIMVVVSQNPNIKKMQGQLADSLAMELNEETEIGRAARLKERLARERKILFVLDDVWTQMEPSEIGIPSTEDELKASQSKIVLTTRRVRVCSLMGSHAQVGLDVLSPNDSWTLFRNAAELTVVDLPHLEDVARKVAEECGGLPVALKSVAKALRRKDLKGWEEAARRFEMSKSPEPYDNDKVLFKCIKLSYDYLIGDDAKSIFMFCCLFPEDFDIQVELLAWYGVGRRLFRDADTLQDARETARSVVDYLIDSSLLLKSETEGRVKMDDDIRDMGRVKMHDVVRDMGLQIISSVEEYAALVRAGVGLKEWPRWKDDYEACKVISLMHNEIQDIPAGGLACPLLQVLLMQAIGEDIREIPDEFFKDVNKSLRILHLSRLLISSLPSSFGQLTSLRSLFLDNCSSVADISMLAGLKKLEILSLRGNRVVKELPQEIAQLTSLRMLDLTDCSKIESIPPKMISSLSRLEELYMSWSFDKWGQGTNASFEEVTCLRRLRILQVRILHPEFLPKNVLFEPNYFKFDIRLGQLEIYATEYSKELMLETTINVLPSWFNNAVTAKAELLLYEGCRGLHNIVEEYDHQEGFLKDLKILSIHHSSEAVNLMDCTNRASNEPVFAKLEQLFLCDSGFKQICVGKLPHGSLGTLKALVIGSCEKLVDVLLPSNLLKHLLNLQILVVDQCDVKEVFGYRGTEELPQLQDQHYRLSEVHLKNLSKLTRICNGSAHHLPVFDNLKFLSLLGCHELENLFTQDISQCFLQLETLYTEDCKALKAIIEREGDGDEATTQGRPSLQEINDENNIIFPQLTNLVLKELPNLACIWSGHVTVKFPSLEYLYVKDCPKFDVTTGFYSKKQIFFNDEDNYERLQNRVHNIIYVLPN